jgi:hypothetical protein
LTFQIKKGREHRIGLQPEFTRVSDNTVIGRTEWMDTDGIWDERYQVLTFRSGKIIDVQDCASRREAERFAHRH